MQGLVIQIHESAEAILKFKPIITSSLNFAL